LHFFFNGNDMAKRKTQPGPRPNHLNIDDENWEDAAKRALQKKKPKGGWPKKGKSAKKSD
jgi:hypothetical protein